jgi:hypothetical protein
MTYHAFAELTKSLELALRIDQLCLDDGCGSQHLLLELYLSRRYDGNF